MIGEVTLRDALESIEANGLKERAEGLANLKHVLRYNQQSTKINNLGDASFHRIYEVLFQVTVTEQSAYLKATKTNVRTAAENRLSSCASTLRLAVEVGVRTVKLKTVRAMLDHVIQTAFLPDGGFCEPIALDYVKCLRLALSYQPHVEHLPQKEWERAALFCVDSIKNAQTADDDAISGVENGSIHGTVTGLSYRSSRSHVKDSVGSQGSRSLLKQVAEEMTVSLNLLTAAPNAPIGRKAKDVLWVLIEFLKANSSTGRAYQHAFRAINNTLAWATTEDIDLTKRAAQYLIRLARHFWPAKSPGLKDEILITLIYLRPYLTSLMQFDSALTLRPELSGLLDVLRTEYGKRIDREQLHMDDLKLEVKAQAADEPDRIGTFIFSLRCNGPRAEQSWMILSTMSFLAKHLSNVAHHERVSDKEDEGDDKNERPRKRQRVTDGVDDILASTTTGLVSLRICTLQTEAFLAQEMELSGKRIVRTLDKLCMSCNEEQGNMSSWAFLAIASVANRASSADATVSGHWSAVWQLACRAMSNASSCRAACHLLYIMIGRRLVSQMAIAELYHTFTTSLDLSGPSFLADSVLDLLSLAAEQVTLTSPSSALAASESILAWLLRRFYPSKFEDRAYAASSALYNTTDIVRLINACLGQQSHLKTSSTFPIWQNVAQSWIRHTSNRELISYLLLLPQDWLVSNPELRACDSEHSTYLTTPQFRPTCEALLLNQLHGEIARTNGSWSQWVRERAKSITLDMFSFLCSACAVSACIAYCSTFRDSRGQTELQRQIHALLKTVCSFTTAPDCGQDKIDAILLSFSELFCGLPRCGNSSSSQSPLCEITLCSLLSDAISTRHRSTEFNALRDEDDMMDMDGNAYDSQDSRGGQTSAEATELRNDIAVAFSHAALRASIALYAFIVATRRGQPGETQRLSASSTGLVDHVLALPETTILSARRILADLPTLELTPSVADTERLLEFLTETMLGQYAFERSEVAIGTVIDILSSLKALWTDANNASLFGLGLDTYEWCTNTALMAGVLSPNVQKKVVSLLLELCHVDTDYGRNSDVTSVRTSLFSLIRSGNVTVQFHLAERISAVFGLFVLSAHEAMFDDLQSSLPTDADWIEGIAMRLRFLAKLASAWHSLLRQCVYYIFETSGRVKSSKEHAARCIEELSLCLQFDSPRRLFTLFAPQLLHSWLESGTLTSLPFATFGYTSLKELVSTNQAEFVAQLLMRGLDDGLHVVETACNASQKELLRTSFAKSHAYAIGWDIANASADQTTATCENRLRAIIDSKEEFKALVTAHFPAIMGQFYLSMLQVDMPERWTEKKPAYGHAAEALAEVKEYSHSTLPLPNAQQPSFKSKYLISQIERLCRRTSEDPVSPWDVSSFTLAVRMLLDAMESPLGSQHIAAMLRKLRTLICMAGDVAYSGYPLEMLLHSLRQLVGDSQCTDDTLGILQYLFQKGQTYLETNPTFLCGTATLAILQLCKYMGIRPDSTTQESQHRATVQKMQAFHTWLVKYMHRCLDFGEGKTKAERGALVNALARSQLPGNARKGSPESALLLLLLDRADADILLMSEADSSEAISLLTNNFEMPAAILDDCLGADEVSVSHAERLWHLIQTPGLDKDFLLWAGTVIGRAYAADGCRHGLRAIREAKSQITTSERDQAAGFSHAAIVRRMSETLFARSRIQSSLAEYTLRAAVTAIQDAEEALAFEQELPREVVPAVSEGLYGYKPSGILETPTTPIDREAIRQALACSSTSSLEDWCKHVAVTLCTWSKATRALTALPTLLQNVRSIAVDVLPCIIHILLVQELEKQPALKTELSAAMTEHFSATDDGLKSKQRYLLNILLYLRRQLLPGERTKVDRNRWLDCDYLVAANAAAHCDMLACALLLAESAQPLLQGNRRVSSRTLLSQQPAAEIPDGLLVHIFKQLEEPDSYYGVQQPASLDTVLERLDYESSGFKSLTFRSAQLDSLIRRKHRIDKAQSAGVIKSLSVLNLNSLILSLSNGRTVSAASSPGELTEAACKLQQWDTAIPGPDGGLGAGPLKALQDLSRASNAQNATTTVRALILSQIQHMRQEARTGLPSHQLYNTLGALAEMSEVLSAAKSAVALPQWERVVARGGWMEMASFDNFQSLLSNRYTLFSVLGQNKSLLTELHTSVKDTSIMEASSLLRLSVLARKHDQLQGALAAATQVNDLAGSLRDMGMPIEAAGKHEVASVLWNFGEAAASVNMLRDTLSLTDVDKQAIPVGRSGLLAQLGHQLEDARLEKPEDILSKYLKPAIDNLNGARTGEEAGNVFFEFASFCDRQLQNPGNIEDLQRATKLRQRKEEELQHLESVVKGAKKAGTSNHELQKTYRQTKQWFEIDDEEYRRLRHSRETFVQQSLQNYMLALQASDQHDICILRFFAMWLENADSPPANEVMAKFLPGVPSWKFVVLMNQLMSRLGNDSSSFQKSLKALAHRICADHPYHALHHLYASTRKVQSKDLATKSRCDAATYIRSHLTADKDRGDLLKRMFLANGLYNTLAHEIPEQKSSKLTLKDMPMANRVAHSVPSYYVPPATMNLQLRPDCNYAEVPVIARWGNTVQIMSGLSAPKAMTAYATDGQPYKQLFKSGNDDLRQDAIMEQVFEEVSKMLQTHKATRQRNLHVRTYKVIPLTTRSGIIEWASSMAFNDFLGPAHVKYYPQDWKAGKAREEIRAAQDRSVEHRVKVYRKVCEHLHPVMRHFFFERFDDPDEWFEKRTAYTRTTATVSILGHVLGLGDRHCQNIMLDEQTGEVIHIDLGVAFEAGRVLPVPELVPFRLTRDTVDGMGATKTEGVFRRCCEFTMDALRSDKDSIMTLLNVLRYDPLYAWSVSPLRAKRMQDAQDGGHEAGDAEAAESSRKKEQEAGEADRALSIVEKKLSKALSTSAAVNELIQQATDERNLATLFSGWSAYF